MAGEASEIELINVMVRLPRTTLEQSPRTTQNIDMRRLSGPRLAMARAIPNGQRQRSRFFTGIRFGETSWDIILELYIAAIKGERFQATELRVASGEPVYTALRHLNLIGFRGYIAHQFDKIDNGPIKIVMLSIIEKAIEAWIDALMTSSSTVTVRACNAG